MLNDIQYFATHYVAFKNNLGENDKGYLINWIKTSSDDQIKSLLIRGDYKFQQESVDLFDKTFNFLNEANVFPGISGYLQKGSGDFLGNINMSQLLGHIEKVKNQAHAAGKSGAMSNVTTGLATAAIAALVITVAYKTYKRFLSKAAKACNNKGGALKTSCMNKYKRDAMKKQVSDLAKGSTACSKTKDPAKCKQKIQTKIRRLKSKLGTL